MYDFTKILDSIIAAEGAEYTNIPGDAGGPTKYGITLKTLTAWRKCKTSDIDVKLLTEAEARKIYLASYIVRPNFDALPTYLLAEELIDAGVQHSPRQAIKILQAALNITEDGILGPQTIEALKGHTEADVVIKFLAKRAHYYASCLTNNQQHNWKFAAGWFNRLGFMLALLGQQKV